MKYEQLAKDIIENVGGKENVNSVVHCITRLRFRLKDEDKAQTDVLENMDGVVTVRKSGGQYQVVIGNHVPDVYKAVVAVGGFGEERPVDAEGGGDKGSLFNQFIDMISSIFTPILSVLVASGMIKGFNAMFIAFKWLTEESGTYQILNAIGDGLFYFLPIFLGYTAMKKFGGTPFLGMVIASALVYPALEGIPGAGEPLYTLFAGTLFESPVYIEFFGIPVILMTYSMSVIPIIISAFFAAKLENFFAKIVPDVIKTFVAPMLTLLIVIPLTFIIIGPIATWASQLLGTGAVWIYDLSPVIAGAFIGGFWLVFVMFGLHWGLVPIALNNFASQGWDPILALIFVHSFALGGAILAVWIRTRNQKIKTLSVPAFISAIFGVTEPGMYGIALPLKRPFFFTLVSSAIGGAMLGIFGTKGYQMGGLGIFQLPSFIAPTGIGMSVIGAVIAAVFGMVLAFVLTYFLGGVRKEEEAQDEVAEKKTSTHKLQAGAEVPVTSPIKGQVLPLNNVSDQVFASEAMGKGAAIVPAEGRVVAPVNGKVVSLFETKHAIGLESEDGIEILIHVGIDTVQLEGEHFTSHVEQGDLVKVGDLLIEFDIDKIKEAGYEVVTPIIITNHDQFSGLEKVNEKEHINENDDFLVIQG